MKNKKLMFLFIFIMFIFPTKIDALRANEISTHFNESGCQVIELATAKEDGNLEKVECYDTYDEAKTKMLETEDDNLVILENGIIINVKYGIIDYDISYENIKKGYIDVYNSSTSNETDGHYIRTPGLYADDAVLLDYDYQTKRVKVKVAGLIGWINKYSGTSILYEVVPLVWTKSLQYYTVEYNDNIKQDELFHHLTANVYDTNANEHKYVLDTKPEYLEKNVKYYSYDGHYFYTNMKVLIDDYKNGNYEQSVNKDNPYYNYYQYLSFRTKTSYNADNINQYINSRTSSTSKLRDTGEFFIWSQDNYGINAILMLAIGINESGSGNSNIAQTKNNLFGLNAVDATPGESSDYFASVEDCIKTYAYKWLSYGYVQPGDRRFKGANLGNKVQGLNHKYASDPFWGEKAASNYYKFDRQYGFQDKNSYTIAVLKEEYNNGILAKKSIDGDKISDYYSYKIKDSAVVVIEEVTKDGKVWYKIQSDPNLDEGSNYVGNSTSNPRVNYNWNSFAYVSSDNFNIILRKIDDEEDEETTVVPTDNETKPKEEPTPSATPSTTPEQTPNPTATPTPSAVPTPTPEPEPVIVYKEINKIISETGLKKNNNNITGIKLNTTVDEIVKLFISKEAKEVSILNVKNEKKTGKIATGDKIVINNGEKQETYDIVIYGDTSGDGEISAVDYVKIKNHIMESAKLTGVYELAADFNNDNNISAVDYVKIKNQIMGE